MEGERIAHVLKIGKLGNFTVGITSDVNDCTLSIRRSRQAMNRHDRKKLTERPMVEQRLEDRKIADVLIAKRSLELLYFVRQVAQTAMHGDDLLRELPIKGVDLRFRFEFEQAEVERLLRLRRCFTSRMSPTSL